jgi:hypothetical protein
MIQHPSPFVGQMFEIKLDTAEPTKIANFNPSKDAIELPAGSEFFNESIYLAVNPDIAKLVSKSKYKSGLDYYTQVGQFEGDKETEGFFTGTEENDVVRGFGADKDITGVDIEASVKGDILTLIPKSVGSGEIDTLVGDDDEDGFYLGLPTQLSTATGEATTQTLYMGNGTKDYGLIRNFREGDYVYLAGDPTDYIYKSEGGDFKIYDKSGDLIGVVQDVSELQVSFYTPGKQGFTLGITGAGFNQSGWVSLYPEVQEQIDAGIFESALDQYINVGQYEEGGWIFSGTTGNDTLISWTQNAEVRLAGITIEGGFEPAGFEPGQYYFGVNPTSFGVGEVDILIHSTDTGTISESLLGWFRSADGSMQRFYVGQGDKDYALVKNFNKNDIDELFFGGAPADYTYENVDGTLQVSYQGDLVAIVEDVKFSDLELADEGEGSGAFVLIGMPDAKPNFFDSTIPVSPGSSLTITNFDPTQDVIQLVGSYDDYSVKRGDRNLRISTKDGKVVATVKGVTDLNQFKGYTPNGTAYLVSPDHQFYQTLASSFFKPYYAFNNPQAVKAVKKGKYKSIFDYHVKVGQFAGEDAPNIPFSYWEGTSGNDTVTGIGEGIGLFGVDVTTIQRQPIVPHGIIGIETASLGIGEVDVLVGQGGGGETVYNLGKTGLSTHPDPKPFYVGQGDADYALIQNFDPTAEEQFISLVGNPIDYTLEQVEGNTRISYRDDLIAIVEGTPNLAILPFLSRDNRFFLASTDSEGFQESIQPYFREQSYFDLYPEVKAAVDQGEYQSALDYHIEKGQFEDKEALFSGTNGRDIIAGFGVNDLLWGVELSQVDVQKEGWVSASTGTGEVDTLIGGTGITTFFIGNDNILNPSKPNEIYYVGNGDQDYVRIKGFDPKQDVIFGSSNFSEYAITKAGADLRIATLAGDLVAIVEGGGSLTLQEIAGVKEVRPRALGLVSTENQLFNALTEG